MKHYSDFIEWYYNEFQQSSLYTDMVETSENSPWHRERNVGVHTDMVVSNYLPLWIDTNVEHDPSDTAGLCGAFAAVFHDVGKPKAAAKNGVKWKPERGHYLSFGGHELISARMWENWAIKNERMLESRFNLTRFDIYRIGWMIEHHLPWSITKQDKLRQLVTTIKKTKIHHVFGDFLLADTYGRISDDASEKRAKSEQWIKQLSNYEECELRQLSEDSNVVLLPIGPSGVGKSTWYQKVAEPDGFELFSWDALRHEWYSDDPEEAFQLSIRDKDFNSKSQKAFNELLKQDKDIYVDNTNLKRKHRRFFVDSARKKGYFVAAILFMTDVETVISRQSTRTDKTVPTKSVYDQYNALQLPQYGEFDHINVI